MGPSVRRAFERGCVWIGAAALACAAGTAAYAEMYQRSLASGFKAGSEDPASIGPGARDVLDEAIVPALEPRPAVDGDVPRLNDGDVIGRLEIPGAGISVMVMEGVGRSVLTVGAGHVPGTALPGRDGNVALAAHRDTFFRGLAGIRPGDAVQIATSRGRYDYVVDSTEVVGPGDVRVLESRGRSELTLITCYPFRLVGPAPRRFIVHARAARPSSEDAPTGAGR